MIDFESMAQGYNQRNGTKYDARKFLSAIYKYHGSIDVTASKIGVCPKTLIKYMRIFNIASTPVLGGNPGKYVIKLNERIKVIPDAELANMTPLQVGQAIGCSSPVHTRKLLRDSGRQYNNQKWKNPGHKTNEQKILAMSREALAAMDVNQVAFTIGCSKAYAYILMSRHKIAYRRWDGNRKEIVDGFSKRDTCTQIKEGRI